MVARAPHGSNQPPRIIVRKVYVEAHGSHHGGAWKVAYADFVTAMMAFFLLMWLLGATTEKQRKALADYFAPTLVEFRQNSAGSNGLFGGESIIDKDNYPHKAAQTGTRSLTIPAGAQGGDDVGTGERGSLKSAGAMQAEDRQSFRELQRRLSATLAGEARFSRLRNQVRFVQTRDGMRIDLMDDADYSMFDVGTTALVADADALVALVGESLSRLPNTIMIRGHTDSLRYNDPLNMNNWMLSSGRAEATRRRLATAGVPEDRFERIEGVADREPIIARDPADPRNRRVAITVLYRRGISR
ncbi:flagellar motor protein MotB [Sphingosinithalassobacter sp. LHW66-3]|uniref:flagellar motor protein MotB n=1 Tax=Sphingosinithalassobacter sp. LHW66-3 TaxID=3424718 RepID=UPI003D6A5672